MRENTLFEVLLMKNRIDELIKEKGYMKKYVAQKVGITPNQLSNWLAGKSYPPLDKAYILADLLGVKVDDLYER
ncbi:helix-turn-helix transcriptional regulator [Acinetobacter baumannii]